ncbi:MAG: EVE domain-containing protein, partial [Alphaproteobacteria bacterium]
FYHSNEGKAVVGIAKVVKTAFPDKSDPTGRFVAVEFAPVRALAKEVPLADIKADPLLSKMEMIRQNRLSVSPVGDAEWARMLKLAGA